MSSNDRDEGREFPDDTGEQPVEQSGAPPSASNAGKQEAAERSAESEVEETGTDRSEARTSGLASDAASHPDTVDKEVPTSEFREVEKDMGTGPAGNRREGGGEIAKRRRLNINWHAVGAMAGVVVAISAVVGTIATILTLLDGCPSPRSIQQVGSYVGQNAVDADAAVRSDSLSPEWPWQYVPDSSHEVVEQNPSEGDTAWAGSYVQLWAQMQVADYRGMKATLAKVAAVRAGLEVVWDPAGFEPDNAHVINGQEPAEGDSIVTGDTLRLIVVPTRERREEARGGEIETEDEGEEEEHTPPPPPPRLVTLRYNVPASSEVYIKVNGSYELHRNAVVGWNEIPVPVNTDLCIETLEIRDGSSPWRFLHTVSVATEIDSIVVKSADFIRKSCSDV